MNSADEIAYEDELDMQISKIKQTLGLLVKDVLRVLGCSQARLARDVGISPSSMNLIAKGQVSGSGRALLTLHDFLVKKPIAMRLSAKELEVITTKMAPVINNLM